MNNDVSKDPSTHKFADHEREQISRMSLFIPVSMKAVTEVIQHGTRFLLAAFL